MAASGRLGWQEVTGYGRRALVQTTMGHYNALIGPRLPALLRCRHGGGRAKEAQRYGAAGSRPQVVWPNGVLASLAVGTVARMLTPWHRCVPPAYLEYDGHKNTVSISPRVAALSGRQ